MTETRRPAQINPDTLPVVITALVIGLLVPASASFTLSFAGIAKLAPWAAVPDYLAWLLPTSIDSAIIGYTLAAYIHLARGESAARAWTWVALWTIVSSTANGIHAWAFGPQGWEGTFGAGLAALFPIGVLLASHTVARIMLIGPGVDTTGPSVPIRLIGADKLQRLVALRQPPAVLAAPVPRPPSAYVKEQRDTIVRLKNEGMKPGDIAEHLDVSRSAVYAQLAAAAKENA